MKIKIASAIGLIIVFVFVVSTQAARPLFAEECPISCPLTSPLTSPLTPPSTTVTPTPSEPTPPVMTPTGTITPTATPTGTLTPTVTPTPDTKGSYRITGTVTLKFMNFFHHGQARMKPAKDVLVTAVNVFTGKKFETRTNEDGVYTINPNESGYYAIHVSEGEARFFKPPVQFVQDVRPRGKRHVDFEGYIFRQWGWHWWGRQWYWNRG